MTKQEQINEMAEILEKAYVDARSNCGSLNQGFGMWYAKSLYNAGYRKLNDGEVIISKEEYDRYLNFIELQGRPTVIDGYKTQYALRIINSETLSRVVRKETAREILQTLYDQCYEYNPRLPEESIGHIIPINILTLAKQYGAEIEE